MLAGMYVTHQGDPCQVVKITQAAVGYGQTKRPPATYVLQPLDGTSQRVLHDPLAVDIPLTVECFECGTPAGFSACVALGTHERERAQVAHERRTA